MAKQVDAPTQEEIAARAQELYVASGNIPGRDLDNWLEAERQLMLGRGTRAVGGITEPAAPAQLVAGADQSKRQAQLQRGARKRY